MRTIAAFLLLLLPLLSYGQPDTLYVFYEHSDGFIKTETAPHSQADNIREEFPFSHNGMYIPVDASGHQEDYFFWYYTYPLKGSDIVFDYLRVDSSYLADKHLIDEKWLKEKSLHELIDIFKPMKKEEAPVIMLIEEDQLNKKLFYIVRVYFLFSAEE